MSTNLLTSRTLLKLETLGTASLPKHEALAVVQHGGSVELVPFVTQLIAEGAKFADSTLPNEFKRQKIQHSPRSKGGDVEVLAGGPNVDEPAGNRGRGEYWFARRSRHTLLAEGSPVAERGKATWDEFVDALFVEHSIKEGEYTPNIYDAHRILDWDVDLACNAVDGWADVRLEIYEMAHAIPFPLEPRVFATLVLTARDSPSSFMTVQIPVDLSTIPSAKYSNGSNRTTGSTPQEKKKPVFGRYVSVERVRRIDADGSSEVQWDMATASDAAGNLPMAVQKIAMGTEIVKDVEYVMNWAANKRGRNEPKITSGGVTS